MAVIATFGTHTKMGKAKSKAWTQEKEETKSIFERLCFSKKVNIQKFQNKNNASKISHGRGNSLRNKVRVWVELHSFEYNIMCFNILKKNPIDVGRDGWLYLGLVTVASRLPLQCHIIAIHATMK